MRKSRLQLIERFERLVVWGSRLANALLLIGLCVLIMSISHAGLWKLGLTIFGIGFLTHLAIGMLVDRL